MELIAGGRLLFVRHAMPEIDPSAPPEQWHLGPGGRAAARRLAVRLTSRLAARVASRVAEPALYVASSEPKAAETLRADHAAATHRTLVVGTHGLALTTWLASRFRLDPDPERFWAALRFPELVDASRFALQDATDLPRRTIA